MVQNFNKNGNHNNKSNNDNSKKEKEESKLSIKEIFEKLPYLFVSVDDSNEDKKLVEEVKLNEYSEELLNGSIQCSMLALNQICVGNSQIEKKKDVEKIINNESKIKKITQTEINPLVVDRKTLISPHSLRGMVSNFFAAFTSVKMVRVQKRHFLLRPNIDLGSYSIKKILMIKRKHILFLQEL